MAIRAGPESSASDTNIPVNKFLKLGYFGILTHLSDFEEDIGQCQNPEEAYFWAIDKEYRNIPEAFAFENLKEDIRPEHQERLADIWKKVLEQRLQLTTSIKTLKIHWANAPDTEDTPARQAIASTQTQIHKRFKRAAIAIISEDPSTQVHILQDVQEAESRQYLTTLVTWQQHEKALRRGYYEANKTYCTVLRLYYEMLIEKPPTKATNQQDRVEEENEREAEWPLPKNHPQRWNIVIQNRYLRLIDATRQTITIAKAIHHEQKEKRLRKTGKVPYAYHVLEATRAYIYDVVSHIIEDENLTHNFVMGVTSIALHDVLEDTAYSIERLMRKAEQLADKYDTRIAQVIQGGFPDERNAEAIEQRSLALLGTSVRRGISANLSVLSKNIGIHQYKQKRRATENNIAPRSKVRRLIGISKEDCRGWEIPPDKSAQSRTFRTFRTSYDDSMDLFLIKLASSPKEFRTQALIDKLEDRAHNLKTLDGLQPPNQLRMLRSTTTRLIPWCLWDWDIESEPLYNALTRVIDLAHEKYEAFVRNDQAGEHEISFINNEDERNLVELRRWKTGSPQKRGEAKVIPLPLPSKAQAIHDRWEAAHAAAA